jgi:hypothetical protein
MSNVCPNIIRVPCNIFRTIEQPLLLENKGEEKREREKITSIIVARPFL